MSGRRHDRGASLVELALVLPILCLLAFGTIEAGRTWVVGNHVEGSVAQAARLGATGGSRVESDRDILVALRASLPEDALRRLDRVVVFLSPNADGQLPSGCIKPAGSHSA